MAIKNARQKGAKYELQIIKLFKDLGYLDCVSSRSESRRTDDAGVDICYLPINIQCKATEKLGSAHDIIARMPADKPNVIFHKRNHKGTLVYMSEEFFIELFKKYFKIK